MTMAELHAAIEATFKAKLPWLETVDYYRENREPPTRAQMPALFFELIETEPAERDNPGTGQLAQNALFEAYLFIDYKQAGKKAKLEIRELAAATALMVHQSRWGVPCEAARAIAMHPDETDPDLDKYEIFRIEWQQVIYLGEDEWAETGDTPANPLWSEHPNIGIPHEDVYAPVMP